MASDAASDNHSTNTLVIGASAAGLASAACLKRAGVEHLVIEATDHVAHAWRNHYERLHLHTPKSGSGLPYFPMPRHYEQYPTRIQVVEYLESYRRHHGIEPHYGQRAERVRQLDDGSWETTTGSGGCFRSQNVVVATGFTRKPHVPTWLGTDIYQGELLHSAAYKNGSAWKDQDVLVVGFGNSGCEIAIDLHERGARPSMAVRSAVNVIARDLFGVPVLTLGIVMSPLPAKLADKLGQPLMDYLIGDITRFGLRKLPYGPNEQIKHHKQIPLLDIGTMGLIKEGIITIHPGIDRFHASGVRFSDGEQRDYAAVVLATGYRPQLDDFLEAAPGLTGDKGLPHVSGRPTELSGLYFCGFYVSPSGMLREIGIEAERIADHIAGIEPLGLLGRARRVARRWTGR